MIRPARKPPPCAMKFMPGPILFKSRMKNPYIIVVARFPPKKAWVIINAPKIPNTAPLAPALFVKGGEKYRVRMFPVNPVKKYIDIKLHLPNSLSY